MYVRLTFKSWSSAEVMGVPGRPEEMGVPGGAGAMGVLGRCGVLGKCGVPGGEVRDGDGAVNPDGEVKLGRLVKS